MQNLDWDIMTYTNNCQTAYSVFYKSLLREYNDCFPIKTIKLNYKNRKPWLTYGLKNSIKEKNRLYVKYMRQNTRCNKTKYKEYKSKLNGLLNLNVNITQLSLKKISITLKSLGPFKRNNKQET